MGIDTDGYLFYGICVDRNEPPYPTVPWADAEDDEDADYFCLSEYIDEQLGKSYRKDRRIEIGWYGYETEPGTYIYLREHRYNASDGEVHKIDPEEIKETAEMANRMKKFMLDIGLDPEQFVVGWYLASSLG